MAEPTSQYYIFQYQDTHTNRYNAMYNLALQELQADYTQRAAQREKLQKEQEKLMQYISNLERDLTDYISQKGKLGQADADKELALMRMYVDIEKAKATQSAQRQARQLDAKRMVQSKYGVPTTTQRAIVDADDAIGSRAAIATDKTQLSALIKTEVGKIVVQNPGSPSALAAAQETYTKVKDTADRKGVGAQFDDAEIRSFINSHYGTNLYEPPKSSRKGVPDYAKQPDPLEYNIGEIEQYEIDNEVSKQYASTGGLSQQASDVKTQLEKVRGTEATKAAQVGLTNLRMSGEYGILLRALSDDGRVTEPEYALFEQMGKDGKTPAAVEMYNAIKDASRVSRTKDGLAALDLKSLTVEEQLIFDDQFLRKLGSLDSSATRAGKIQKELETPLQAPTLDQATMRARELYNPIRMTGSPEFQTFELTDPVTGKKFKVDAQQMIQMQQDFERVLDENPDFERNFRVVGAAQELSKRIKPPSKTADQTSPEYLGYQIFQQYQKNKTVFTPAEISSLAAQLGGSQEKADAILTNFHAYNMQSAAQEVAPPRDKTGAANQFLQQMQGLAEAQEKGLEVERADIRRRAEAIDVETARKELEAAKAAERGGFLGTPFFRSPEAQAAQDLFLQEQKEFGAIEQQRADILKELEDERLLIERYRTKAAETGGISPKEPAPDVQEVGKKPDPPPAQQPKVVVGKDPALPPLNTNLVNKSTYNYQVISYSPEGVPTYVFVGGDGKQKPGTTMTAGMIAEAQAGFDAQVKALAGDK